MCCYAGYSAPNLLLDGAPTMMNVAPAARRAKKLAIHFGADASPQVRTMLQRQSLGAETPTQRDMPAGSIGCVGRDALPAQGNLCLFIGLPINGPDVVALDDADSAMRLLPTCDGAFAGVFWDAQRDVLVVVTDCLGMQPLYMRHAQGELTLVSDTKALEAEPDLAAWGAFVSIGHPIGSRSLADGLQRVPPASVLTYDCARRQLSIRRYWHWPEPSDAWRGYDFLQALGRDMRAYAALGGAGTLLLSGGFDSRLLLFLLKRAHIPADAMIVAHQEEHDDADGRLAQAVAKLAGMEFRRVTPPADFFSSPAYVEYLRASDVGYPSLDLFIAKVASQIDSGAVWDGLAPGFVFMPLHQPEGGFDAYLQREIRGPDSAIWRAARILFKPDVVEAMSAGFSQDLQDEIARLPHDMHGLARFVIENRSRNRASMNPLKVYANRTNAFTPGLSKDFMAHAATIPFEQKQHGRFYRALFAQLDKRALAVPFLSGGELLKASRLSAGYYRERLHLAAARYRARYPSLFAGAAPGRQERSVFLGPHLLEGEDPWLDPRVSERLKTVSADNYLAWKLLLHWKAWRVIHSSHPEKLSGRLAAGESSL